jgi:hypothetical protein
MKAPLQSKAKTSSSTPPTFAPVRNGLLQRKCAYSGTPGPTGECESCRKKGESGTLQRAIGHPSSLNSHPSDVPPIVHEVLRSSGQPLDLATRDFMEPRFGHDFSGVRVHKDEKAAESARSVNALAFTVGQDIVFGGGQLQTQTEVGQKLLAHELTHTIQQGATRPLHPAMLEMTAPGGATEREAEVAANSVMRGHQFTSTRRESLGLARQATSLPTAPTYLTTPQPAASVKKKVTVNVTNLNGAGGRIGSALTYANTLVYNQAQIEIQKGKEVTLDEAQSKATLGNDLIVDEYADAAAPTNEEKRLLKWNQTGGGVTAYFVKGFSRGSLGEAFWASSGSGLIGFIVGSVASDNTFSHELGHVLLDDGGHNVPDATYLMHATATGPTKLTPEQITKIQASPFAK